ncbi:MAG: YtxH domain-containing protein [Bacteroidetes bacterium]|nr:YtxH domain-containing protein [Bacteroidota bacterium]
MRTRKILFGVFAGVAFGAALGILFAPDKGSSTRKKIIEKGDDFVEGMEDKFNEYTDRIGKKVDNIKRKVTRIAENAKDNLSSSEG